MSSELRVDTIKLANGNSATASGLGIDIGNTGKIAQQVVSSTTTSIMSTSSSFIDTGLSLNITPSSATSTINLFCGIPIRMDAEGGTDNGMKLQFLRDSTGIWVGDGNQLYLYGGSSYAETNFQWTQYVSDSPNTTSQITYKVQSARNGNTRFTVMLNSRAGYLVAQEVLA